MNKGRFKLFYQDLAICEITQIGGDGFSCHGSYNLVDDFEKEGMLWEYIIHSEWESHLLEADESGVLYERIIKAQQKFLSLINSEEWRLEDNENAHHPILIPVFFKHN